MLPYEDAQDSSRRKCRKIGQEKYSDAGSGPCSREVSTQMDAAVRLEGDFSQGCRVKSCHVNLCQLYRPCSLRLIHLAWSATVLRPEKTPRGGERRSQAHTEASRSGSD